MSNTEQTLSIIKPDAVERNLDNEIKQMFIKNGFNISLMFPFISLKPIPLSININLIWS